MAKWIFTIFAQNGNPSLPAGFNDKRRKLQEILHKVYG